MSISQLLLHRGAFEESIITKLCLTKVSLSPLCLCFWAVCKVPRSRGVREEGGQLSDSSRCTSDLGWRLFVVGGQGHVPVCWLGVSYSLWLFNLGQGAGARTADKIVWWWKKRILEFDVVQSHNGLDRDETSSSFLTFQDNTQGQFARSFPWRCQGTCI